VKSLLFALAMAEGEGPSSPFEIEFGLIFWTWLVFIGLFFALKKFAWPAILQATEERERRIADQLEEAERMNAEAKAALEEHKKLVANAHEQAQSLVAEAKSIAEKERQSLLEKARSEQEQLVAGAKREIQAERDRAVAELRKEAVELSLAAASKLIEENLDDKVNRKLVQGYLSSLDN